MSAIRKISIIYPRTHEYRRNPSYADMIYSSTYYGVALYYQTDDNEYIAIWQDENDGNIKVIPSTHGAKFLGFGSISAPITQSAILLESGSAEDVYDPSFEFNKSLYGKSALAQGDDIYNSGISIENERYDLMPSFGYCQTEYNGVNPGNKWLDGYNNEIDFGIEIGGVFTTDNPQVIHFGHPLPILPGIGPYVLFNSQKRPHWEDSIIYLQRGPTLAMARMGGYSDEFDDNPTHEGSPSGYMPITAFDILSGYDCVFDNPDDAKDFADNGAPAGDDEESDSPNEIDNIDNRDPGTDVMEMNISHFYVMDTAAMGHFLDFFWTAFDKIGLDIVINQFTGIYSDLSQNVGSFRMMTMPVNIDTAEAHIVVGKFDTEITAPAVLAQHDATMLASYNFSTMRDKMHSDRKDYFLCYPPYTSASLYLPYYGIVDLDINKWSTLGQLQIYLDTDVMTGSGMYKIFYSDGKAKTLSQTYEVQLAYDIPVALTDTLDTTKKSIDAAMGIAAGAATGKPSAEGLIGNNWSDPTKVIGSASSGAKLFAPDDIILIVETSNASRNDSYPKAVGYPCNKSAKLSTFSGWVQVENPHIDNFHGTAAEYAEVVQILSGGVFI